MSKSLTSNLRIRPATANDIGVIMELIRALADFERLPHEVVATEELLRENLFGDKPAAEVLIAEIRESESSPWRNAGFALFFTSFSTFLGKPGLYLEDLFVRPELRSQGIGRRLLAKLAELTVERNFGRLEWSVLDWNTRALEFYASLGAKPMNEWTVQRLTGDELRNLAKEAKPLA